MAVAGGPEPVHRLDHLPRSGDGTAHPGDRAVHRGADPLADEPLGGQLTGGDPRHHDAQDPAVVTHAGHHPVDLVEEAVAHLRGAQPHQARELVQGGRPLDVLLRVDLGREGRGGEAEAHGVDDDQALGRHQPSGLRQARAGLGARGGGGHRDAGGVGRGRPAGGARDWGSGRELVRLGRQLGDAGSRRDAIDEPAPAHRPAERHP